MNRHKLIYYMGIKGIDNHQLGDKVGVTPQWISELRNGRKRPKIELIVKLADALEITVDDLVRE